MEKNGVFKNILSSPISKTDIFLGHPVLDDSVCKEVNLAINNDESRMIFIDHKHGEMTLEAQMVTYKPDAVMVVMSVDNTGRVGHGILRNILEQNLKMNSNFEINEWINRMCLERLTRC